MSAAAPGPALLGSRLVSLERYIRPVQALEATSSRRPRSVTMRVQSSLRSYVGLRRDNLACEDGSQPFHAYRLIRHQRNDRDPVGQGLDAGDLVNLVLSANPEER